METQRGVLSAGHRRSVADEREPHAVAFPGAAHGGIRRANRSAQPKLVPELPAQRSGPFARAGHAALPGDPADRPRSGDLASAGGISGRTLSRATGALAPADRAAE